jgi:small subunit ribosomal protein S16
VAVKIKLKRLGKIRAPYYRIIIADARTKRDGRAIEEIGKYHPKTEPSFIEVDSERAQYWLSVGAQPTDPVRKILEITGDWQKFKGLPGSEGTLRMAAPKEDRKEIFAAAVLENLGDGAASPKGRAKAKSADAKGDAAKADAGKAEPAAKQAAPAKAKPAKQAKAADQPDTAKAAAKAADAAPAAKASDTAKPAAKAADAAPAAKASDTAKPAAKAADAAPAAKASDTAKPAAKAADDASAAKASDTAKPAAKADAPAAAESASAEQASEPGSGD